MFALLTVVSANAATLTVGPTKTYDTIAKALRASADGDLILVDPGTYIERLLVHTDVTIRATGSPEETVIADGAQLSVLKTWNDLVLEGFTVTTSTDVARHCIRVAPGASIILRDAIVTECTAGDGLGGGLRFDTDTWGIVEDTVFADNHAVDPRGARAAHLYSRADSLEIYRTLFIRGTTEIGDLGDGGALFANSGTLVIEDSAFIDNIAGDDGGAIGLEGLAQENLDHTFSDGVHLAVLKNNVFQGNSAGGNGGVLFSRDVNDVQVSGNVFCDNAAAVDGGAFYLERNGGEVANNLFVDHFAGDDGGTLFLKQESPGVANNHLIGSEAAFDGGAIFAMDVPQLDLGNDLIAWTRRGAAISVDDDSVVASSNNAFFANADGNLDGFADDGDNVQADPDLRRWIDNGVCWDDDFRPTQVSPLVDAGAPWILDHDGSLSDIGAFGGALADPCLLPDAMQPLCKGR